ncbi:MAG TPA: S9 family peptidase [Thermoanaerobaculia bacterium]|nr:S9 family peptidase [Thermoanaerobaculia bacterium]
MASLRGAMFGGLLVTMSALPAAAQTMPPPIEQVLDTVTAGETFRGVALSPDGARVAWVESVRDKDGRPTPRSAIFVTDLAGGSPHQVTARTPKAIEIAESDPAWSPEGRRLAFISDAVGGEEQIFLADVSQPEPKPRQVTKLHGHLSTLRFSPDGSAVAFLYIEGRKGPAGPLQATARDAGVVGEHPEEQRLAVVDLASGEVRTLSPTDLYVYEYDWAPDGRSFAATAAHGSGDDNWYDAELYTLNRESGEMRSLWKPPVDVQIAVPRVSPDGRAIALIGGIMSDEGSTGGDVYLVPAAGGEARNLAPGRPASPAWLAWTSPTRLLVAELADQDTALTALDLSGDLPGAQASTLWHGPESLTDGRSLGLALSRDGRISAAIHHDFGHAPEVWAGPIGAWRQVSHSNARFTPAWGEARSLHWTTDAGKVQGWLLSPPRVEPGKRYPLAVVVHGGPASAHRSGWPVSSGVLASQGYYVFLPNPRGSYGQGETFTRGNIKDFGYGDLRDILAGVEAVIHSGAPIDSEKVGLYGWSYGGYMAMWTVTQTDRFRAVVAGAGIVNWQSYYGQNRIDQWMIPYFGASVYADPFIYARSSPITFITRTKTPTLVLQGERDAEVPAPQAYEFWHALKTLGVPTELVVYPDEGHRFNKPEDDRDRYRRICEWFGRYLR